MNVVNIFETLLRIAAVRQHFHHLNEILDVVQIEYSDIVIRNLLDILFANMTEY